MIRDIITRLQFPVPVVLSFALFSVVGVAPAQSITRASKSAVLVDVSLGSGNNGFEDADGILLGNNGTSNATDWRSFIKFDLPPLGLNPILSAKLRVYHQYQSTQNTGNVSIKALRITQDWIAPTSYNPSIYNVPTADDGVASNLGGGGSGVTGSTMDTYVEFNVLPIVLAWHGGQPNYGICMRPANENLDYSFKVITSSREDKQPELIIEYQTGGGPTSAPVVNGQSVSVDAMRFSVIAPDCIRIENSRRLAFVDGPTSVIRQRNLGAVPFTHSVSDTHLTITTTHLALKYRLGSNSLHNSDLTIDWMAGGRSSTWMGGQTDGQNLGGTRYDLDRVGRSDVPNYGIPTDIGTGLLSREGWHLLDDSNSMIWPEGGWMSHRGDDASVDYYFCAYGDNYKRMLQLFVDMSGKTPMVPNYTFGIWYSRYQDYTQSQFQAIVDRYRSEDIPFDVMGIDVDWHRHGWEGYDWNTSLIGNPKGMIGYFKSKGVKSYLNSHPGGFIQTQDTHWAPGKTAAGINATAPYRFHFYDQDHVQATQSVNLKATLLNSGVDFWWPDGSGRFSNFRTNSALATGKAYYEVPREIDASKRGLILNRYGGLGAQRYPIGFSGDTGATWQGLNYQPAFTARASNVAFPYWSHDIGGFDPYGYKVPDELYLRWAQFGVFSPVVRNHASHAPRLPWEYPNVMAQVKDIYKFRSRLFPYIYHYSRVVHDSGIGLIRPLYFEHPSAEEAYAHPHEYYFGADLLAAPVTAQSSGGVANQKMWLPPGKWTDYWTGEVRTGPGATVYAATLNQIPVYVRPGAIIPQQPDMKYIGEVAADPLTLEIFPHAAGYLDFYEDDGLTLGYETGQSTRTPIALSAPEMDGSYSVDIGQTIGSFSGQLASRVFILKLRKGGKPQQILADNVALGESANASAWNEASSGWYYDAAKSTTWVKLARRNSSQAASVQVQMSGGITQVAAPSFSPGPGIFATGQNVAISSSTTGSTIRYTTNGTEPTTTSGMVYSGPISINATTTLKAIAYQSGLSDSGVASGLYTIGPAPPLTDIFQDTFTDGGFTDGSDPLDGQWRFISNTTPGTKSASSGALAIGSQTQNGSGLNPSVVTTFTPHTLQVGETITLSFDFSSSCTSAFATGLRYGLYNSGGTGPASDFVGNPPNVGTVFQNDLGYSVFAPTLGAAGQEIALCYRPTNTIANALQIGSTSNTTVIGTRGIVTPTSANSTYSASLAIQRNSATAYLLTVNHAGTTFSQNYTPAAATQTFDTLTIWNYVTATNTYQGLTVDNVRVTIGTPVAATALQSWRALHALAQDGSQDLANPSGDGVANLLRYALNLTPNAGDLALPNARTLADPDGTTIAALTGLPVLRLNGTTAAVFTYIRRKSTSGPGITYSVQWSDGLSGWAANPAAIEATVPLDDTWERVTLTDSFTVTGKPARFARLSVATQ